MVASSGYFAGASQDSFQSLNNVAVTITGQTASVSLPHTFSGLAARTQVTVTADVVPQEGDYLYVKSVYAPLKVYADGQLIYEYGQAGTYPSFMTDPATGVKMVRLPQTEDAVHLSFCLSRAGRQPVLHFPASLRGIWLFISLCGASPFQRIFFSGFFMLLISLFITFFEPKGISFLWLGLFSLAAGFWTFGECNLTVLFIRSSATRRFCI